MADLNVGIEAIAEDQAAGQYALLDLGSKHDLLNWLYSTVECQAAGSWEPLLLETPFASRWNLGPALVDLGPLPGAKTYLKSRCGGMFPGVLIHSDDLPLESLASQLRACLFTGEDRRRSLLRFYDPTLTAPFLTVLTTSQRLHLLAGSKAWSWQQDSQWYLFAPPPEQASVFQLDQWAVTDDQLKQLEAMRNEPFIASLTERYGPAIREYRKQCPLEFVAKALATCEQIGLSKRADVERLLRWSIENGSVEQEVQWSDMLARDDMTGYQKLEQLEQHGA